MTEGNCFLLGELVRAVEAEGWEPTARNAARIGTLAPEAVLRAVAVRLMRLSDDAAGVARAVAILGEDAQLRHVAALTGRDAETRRGRGGRARGGRDPAPGRARRAALRPPAAGLRRLRRRRRGRARGAAPARRRDPARRGDLVRARRGAPAAERRQRRGVGRRRAVRGRGPGADGGAPESAASYLRRALEEPPTAGARAGVLRQLGLSEAATGLPTATARLEEALEAGVDDARARAHAARSRSRARVQRRITPRRSPRSRRPRRSPTPTRSSSPRRAPRRSRSACCIRAAAGRCWHRRSRRRPRRQPGRDERRLLAATLCLREAMAGNSRATVARARARGARRGTRCSPTRAAARVARRRLARAARVRRARVERPRAERGDGALARARVDDGLRDGEPAARRVALGAGPPRRGDLRRRAGDRRRALRLAPLPAGGLRHARQPARRPRRAPGRGRLAARLDLSAHAGSAMLAPWHAALGRLALVDRREADALEHFAAWRDAVAGVRNPASFADWRSASRARADGARARRGGARARRRGARARAALRRAARDLGRAARGRARRRAGRSRASRSRCSTEAVAVAAASEARLEHCRALLELGTVLRRAGRRTDAGRALGEASSSRASAGRGSCRSAPTRSSRSPARACSARRGAAPTR